MVLGKRKLVAAAVAVVVLAAGGAAFVATQKPDNHSPSAQAGQQRGPGGPGGPGQRGPGGPGGRNGGGGPPTQVTAVPVSAREFAVRIEDLGTLEPKERVTLTANAADRVTGVFFEDGQRVARGKVLMTLVNEEESAQLESAQATAANAKLVFERNQRLAANDAIAQLELERTKSAYEAAVANVAAIQARLRDRVLVAPFSGVLGFRQISQGAYVSPGQAVATLIDDSEMRLEFGVPSINITTLRVGLPVEATTKDVPGRTFSGRITSIDNAIDPVTLAVKVRATLPNKEGALRAGMSMNATLMAEPRNSLSVPEISVVAEGSKSFVYIVDQSKQPAVVAKTEVVLGARERGLVEVVSGLQAGDMVVTDGVLKLRPNSPVRLAGGA
ncbi:MAG TPA: efflux RND transporter periplasmic adaptor subunit, partial [Hyphomonadaceae bacterium]|nr:efflux RND transporter periplasmic adaptor subunit [Hyphomonadaceae bacterium]